MPDGVPIRASWIVSPDRTTARVASEVRAEHQSAHARKRSAARNAEQMRVGERVAEQRLQRRAGGGQRAADDGGEKDARDPRPQEDHGVRTRLRAKVEGAPPVDADRPERRRLDQRDGEHGKQRAVHPQQTPPGEDGKRAATD